MPEVSTLLTVGLAPALTVSHQERHVLAPAERFGVILESERDNDVLTTVSVAAVDADPVTIRIHWSSSAAADFHVLFVPETNLLFVGGGQISAAVDLSEMVVATQEAPLLFWSFERVDRYVVEYGELECLLYDLNGHVLDRASVDPPYEVHRLAHGIHFVSMVAGSTWLTFPVVTPAGERGARASNPTAARGPRI